MCLGFADCNISSTYLYEQPASHSMLTTYYYISFLTFFFPNIKTVINIFPDLKCKRNPLKSAWLSLHDGHSSVQLHFSFSPPRLSFVLPPSFLPSSLPSGPALPGHSSRRVHFERINTVPIKGQRAARRSTRKHHSLSRTLLRYGKKYRRC